ncbi:MAG: sigma-54 dependent transcriptional regulator [Candidatus Neomarinimicrobiota bacterium]
MKSYRARIAIVDDDPKIVYAIKMILENEKYEIFSCSSGKQCLDLLTETDSFDAIFLDIAMPEISGLQVLEEMKNRGINIPVIVITGFGTADTAIKAIQLGAFEYITKPLDMQKIKVLAQRAIEVNRMKEKIADLQHALRDQTETEARLLGNSSIMQEVFKKIGATTTTPNITPVLIEGESGTGKELVAKAIHKNSSVKNQPFIVINCTTLPENLLESELYGYEKGAFTDAHERKLGKMELAKEGILFFDEIGDLSQNLQQKLLRVLQEREFERLGSNKLQKIESRFVFATNRNLEKEVSKGLFREDLWYRINVFPIRLPPLRDRRDDIPLFVEHFMALFSNRLNKMVTVVPEEVMELLLKYNYPGNVRELKNIIEHGIILSKSHIFDKESLQSVILQERDLSEIDFNINNFNLKEAKRDILNSFEKKFLIELLKTHHGNVILAAKNAGIERQSLYRLLKKHCINPKIYKSK